MMAPAGKKQLGGFPCPGRLWSLLDMINFSFGAAHSLLVLLNNAASVSKKNMTMATEFGGGELVYCDQEFKSQLSKCADASLRLFAELASPHVDTSLRRLKAGLYKEQVE
jgi:hypothetical protein